MKHVYSHENLLVVNSAKNFLALHAIDSVIKNDAISSLSARHGIENTFCELWILNDQEFEKATEIIDKEIENPTDSFPWVCRNCNEQNAGSFELCWNCQEEKPIKESLK